MQVGAWAVTARGVAAEQQPLQQQEANEALGEEAEELLEQEVVVCVAGMACAHGLYEFELQIGV